MSEKYFSHYSVTYYIHSGSLLSEPSGLRCYIQRLENLTMFENILKGGNVEKIYIKRILLIL